ncbi:TetR/AcrR family transcriptional regulator [Sagittula salina]|uniref:TetR family transcriptional regulator n=1 Tax=Sagittula salina TaxID=2820268 RepID=A0A940S3T6_9RHOB|nr:TetR/AcrR family transcriptional regulator [Sagittula salina]MBP0483394.1 TetR family transcriptional regulator [Sagittula salina]
MARTQGSHSEITGPRIHAAAQRLFARHGFAAVSMRQIAADVGLQVGALYNYTPDKQALLFSLLEGHMLDLMTAWEAAAPSSGPLARLEAFVRFHIAFHLARPEAVFIAYMELRNLTEENFAKIGRLRHDYEQRLEQILRDGRAEGRFDIADTKLTTLALIAMLTGVTTWYRDGGRLGPEAVADHYWSMVLKAVSA